MKPKEKWKLEVWPAGQPRFVKKPDETGRMREVANHLFRRDYDQLPSSNRALPYLKRTFPNDQIERTRFVFKGWAWVAESGSTEILQKEVS
jgi:hypothetical protein